MEHEEILESSLSNDLTLPVVPDPSPGAAEHFQASLAWKRVRRALRVSTFSPPWLPTPWSMPTIGYLAAVCLPAIAVLLTILLLHLFPTFALQGVLSILAILIVALLWGTGPGLIATLLGAILLNFVLLPPSFTWSLSLGQPIIETGVFLVIGATISLVVSRIEYARSEAERARQRVEQLVTQLEQEQAHTAEQASKLETIIATITDGVYVYDTSGRVLHTNLAAQAFNPSIQQEDYLTRSFPERFTSFMPRDEQGQPFAPENLPVIRILHGEVLTGAQAVDTVLRTADGDDLQFNVTGAPIRDQTGHIRGAVIVTRDVTERRHLQHESEARAKRTHDALQALLQFAEALVQGERTREPEGREDGYGEQEGAISIDLVAQRLAALIHQVLGCQGVSLTAFDAQTRELRATASIGLAPDQERAWRERRPGFTIGELVAGTFIEQHLLTGEAVVIDLGKPPFAEHPTAYGPRKLLLVPMSLEGQLTGVVTLDYGDASRDYTEEELSLAKALAQLAALTLERERLFQERAQAQATVLALRETNQLMDEFIGIAGHELRTPLTTIKGSVELAKRQMNKILKQRDILPAEVTAMLTTIQGHLDRTERQIRMQNRLVSDLLDVARIHANRLELHPDLCDLVTLVRESVEDQQYLTSTRTIELTTKVPEEVLVIADADRVRQVINNYLSNALKYSEADKPVDVCLELVSKLIRLSVHDEGPGLTRAQQQRIWERFYRVPEVEVKSGSGIGLGLGLHISRMIIERLGGQVGVQSTPNKGSTFWFALPLAEANEQE